MRVATPLTRTSVVNEARDASNDSKQGDESGGEITVVDRLQQQIMEEQCSTSTADGGRAGEGANRGRRPSKKG